MSQSRINHAARAERLRECDLSPRSRRRLRGQLPELRHAASVATDPLAEVALGIRRRKLHKSGATVLPGATVRYRTYEGSISAWSNAFVVGKLENDYGPLLARLVQEIGRETGWATTDRGVARLFLEELGGADAFTGFSMETRRIAHKIVAIILFAELSRHSLNLVGAAAAFHAVASRPEGAIQPGLVESFMTGSRALRPLFAGKGGAKLSRGEPSRDIPAGVAARREARAVLDLHNYFVDHRKPGETFGAFVERKTREITVALSAHAYG
jgi:hypothetical protein